MNDDRWEDQLKELLDDGALDRVLAVRDALGSRAKRTDLAPLIETAERRKRLLALFSVESPRARGVSCPSCDLKLRVVSESSRSVGCYGCGAIIEIGSLQIVGERSDRLNQSALTLGHRGTIDGTSVEVIGRVGYHAETREYDAEDNTYESGTWYWEEWSLLTSSGVTWFLSVDSEGYALARPFTPATPAVPFDYTDEMDLAELSNGGGMFGGLIPQSMRRTTRIDEWGKARIVATEGELSWVPNPEEEILYAEQRDGSRGARGVEWRRDSASKETIEAEFYRSESVSYAELLGIFPVPELIESHEYETSIRRGRLGWATSFMLVGVLLLIRGAVWSKAGSTIFSKSVDLSLTASDTGYLMGPVGLLQSGLIYEVSFGASIPDNSDVWLGVEILDRDKSAINAPQADFWRESGYEDGEHYSESNLSAKKRFQLQEPGYYFLRLFSETEPGQRVSGTAHVAVNEGVQTPVLYVLCGIVSLVIGFVLRMLAPQPRNLI